MSSITPAGIPLTYGTRSGRLVLPPPTVTSSAIAKSLVAGFFQSIRGTVTVCWPTARAHLGTVANEILALAGGVSEGVAAVERGDLIELVQRLGDERGGAAPAGQESPEQVGLDSPGVFASVLVAEAGLGNVVPAVVDQALQGLDLKVADRRHCWWLWGLAAGWSSTFQWPPLAGPTRSIFPAVRSLSIWYRMVDSVVPSAAAISRRLAAGFRRRSERMRWATEADSGGVPADVSGFWLFSGCFLVDRTGP